MADPIVTRANMDKLELAFPPTIIKPGVDLQTLMYNAGQRSVVEYIRTQSKYPKNATVLLDGIIKYSPEGGIKREHKYNIYNIYAYLISIYRSIICNTYNTIYRSICKILYITYCIYSYVYTRIISAKYILVYILSTALIASVLSYAYYLLR